MGWGGGKGCRSISCMKRTNVLLTSWAPSSENPRVLESSYLDVDKPVKKYMGMGMCRHVSSSSLTSFMAGAGWGTQSR